MNLTKRFIQAYLAVAVGLLLAGCGDHREPVVYSTPKEDAVPAAAPVAPMRPMGGSGNMASQALPAEALNQESGNPQWSVPAGWTEVAASSMRRASFSADGPGGAVDIAVTSFPGDVGGLLANINRWRGQIGLAPLEEADLETAADRLNIGGKEAIVTRMSNGTESTHAAIFTHGGNSWFFKMTGPAATVEEQASAFMAYIESIRFPTDA